MSATFWLVFSIVCFSLAFVALTVAVFAFIKMNVPAIIGDINGKTVARGVEAMKRANERGAKRTYNKYGVSEKKPIDIDLKASSNAMSRAHISKRLDMAPDQAEAIAQQMHSGKGSTENIYAAEQVQHVSEQQKGRDYKTTPLGQTNGEQKGEHAYKTTPLKQNHHTEDTVDHVVSLHDHKTKKAAAAHHTSVLNSGTTVLNSSPKQQYGTTVLEGMGTGETKPSVEIEIITKKISVNTDEII